MALPVQAQTWTQAVVPTRTVDQPGLGGSQSIAPGLPGAAFSEFPRPVQIDATIFRSFSGFACGSAGLCISIGGGHAGHPGNDIDLFDTATQTWTKPYDAECPPPYHTTTLSTPYVVGGTSIVVATANGFEVGGRIWLNNSAKTELKVVSIVGTTVNVTVTAKAGSAPAGTSLQTPNGTWRGIKGGATATQGFSPSGKPWVHHTYRVFTWDTKRNRPLFMSGNGLMAYDRASKNWALLAGRNRYVGEVTIGSPGGVAYDEVTDSLYIFGSDTANGAGRGVWKYTFATDGSVATKAKLHDWPTLPNWSFATKLVTAISGPGRLVYLMMQPVSPSPTAIPPQYRLFTYNLDTKAFVWDQTLVPGQPAYDALAQANFTTWERRSATGQLYFYIPALGVNPMGFWVKTESTNSWAFIASLGGKPAIARWTFTYDKATDSFMGLDVRNLYGYPGTASGGFADTWRLTFSGGPVIPPPVPVASVSRFDALPTVVGAGQLAVLTWITANAKTVTLNGAIVGANGSQNVGSGTYDLVADGITRRAIVTQAVVVPPVVVNDLDFTINGIKYRLELQP